MSPRSQLHIREVINADHHVVYARKQFSFSFRAIPKLCFAREFRHSYTV